MQDMIRKIIEADNEAKALNEANRKAAEEEKLKIEKEAEAIYKQQMDNAKKEIAKNDDYLENVTTENGLTFRQSKRQL